LVRKPLACGVRIRVSTSLRVAMVAMFVIVSLSRVV
jgi:hypothetical protein